MENDQIKCRAKENDENTERPQVIFHYITVKTKKYLLVEDVVNMLKDIGDTQPTDTRKSLYKLANNMTSVAYGK